MKRMISVFLACVMAMSMCVTAGAVSSVNNFSAARSYPEFSDVSSDSWFYNFVSDAYCYGLVNGNSQSTYNPNGNMTLAEALALACRIHNIYNGGNGVFTQGKPWYQVYVDYAKKNGIYDGSGNPTVPVTRLQFAHIMYATLPESEFAAVNSVTSVPDTTDSIVLKLYQAGVVTGDASKKYNPNDNIKRSEVAKIALNMVCPEKRTRNSNSTATTTPTTNPTGVTTSSTTVSQENLFDDIINLVVKNGEYIPSGNYYRYKAIDSDSQPANFMYGVDNKELYLTTYIDVSGYTGLATITFVMNGVSTLAYDGTYLADYYLIYDKESNDGDICVGRVDLDTGKFTVSQTTNSSDEFIALSKEGVMADASNWRLWKSMNVTPVATGADSQSNPFSKIISLVEKNGRYVSSDSYYEYKINESNSQPAYFHYYTDSKKLELCTYIKISNYSALATITLTKDGVSAVANDGTYPADFFLLYSSETNGSDLSTGRVDLNTGKFTVTQTTNSSDEFISLSKEGIMADALNWGIWKQKNPNMI